MTFTRHGYRPAFYASLLVAAMLTAQTTRADSMRSRCGYAPTAEAEPEQYQDCVFSQRQGYISINLGGEIRHQFSPDGELAGTFLDQEDRRVYRKRGLGDRGQLFQLPQGYLYVLWNPVSSRLECQGEDLAGPEGCHLGDGRVGFALIATSGSSLNELTLTPVGLEIDNQPQQFDLDGSAYLAELADLDSNGWPEVYVYVSSAGSGSYGSLVALAVNNGKSATPIYLPPLDQNAVAADGYQGHDEFRVVENRLVRRYPVYRDGDTNANPTGGTRQVQYRLEAGEAGWQLQVDRVVNY